MTNASDLRSCQFADLDASSAQSASPPRYFDSSPEVIRLVIMTQGGPWPPGSRLDRSVGGRCAMTTGARGRRSRRCRRRRRDADRPAVRRRAHRCRSFRSDRGRARPCRHGWGGLRCMAAPPNAGSGRALEAISPSVSGSACKYTSAAVGASRQIGEYRAGIKA